jgi:hypothetical protein
MPTLRRQNYFQQDIIYIFLQIIHQLVRWCSWLSRSPHSLNCISAKGPEFEPRLNHRLTNVFILFALLSAWLDAAEPGVIQDIFFSRV